MRHRFRNALHRDGQPDLDGGAHGVVLRLGETSSRDRQAGRREQPMTGVFRDDRTGRRIGDAYVLVVNPQFPAQDLDGLVKTVQAAPGKYNYASAGVGTAPHLAVELFMRAANVKLVHVPYQGSGPALVGVVAGDVQVAIDNVAAIPLIKSGKLRALAQTGKRRSDALPDVPTFTEAGLPQFDVSATWGLLAPAGVPDKAVAVLSEALARAVADPAIRETLLAQGIVPESGTAQQFGAVLQAEETKWSRLIDEANIKP